MQVAGQAAVERGDPCLQENLENLPTQGKTGGKNGSSILHGGEL